MADYTALVGRLESYKDYGNPLGLNKLLSDAIEALSKGDIAHVAVQLGESAAASVTVELTEAESEVLDDFAKRQDLSRPAVMRQALRAYQMESVAIPFWQKHALGSLARLSCFKCGGNEHEAAIKHMELPNIYICTACVGSAAARVPEGFKLVLDPDEDMEVAGMEKSVLAEAINR
jgi:hypothetical protein